jgi:hypothetical protein
MISFFSSYNPKCSPQAAQCNVSFVGAGKMNGMKQQGQQDMTAMAPQVVEDILLASDRMTGTLIALHFGHLTRAMAGRQCRTVVLYNLGPSVERVNISRLMGFISGAWTAGGFLSFWSLDFLLTLDSVDGCLEVTCFEDVDLKDISLYDGLSMMEACDWK